MTLKSSVRRAAIAVTALAFIAAAAPVFADETIPESHLKAARDAVAAIHATQDFDSILPQAAAALKQELIQKNPDLQEIIIKTVDEETLKLVGRRTDLEKEAALAYAKVFSEDDLTAIAAFYNSAPGQKLLSDGPIVTREVFKAADIWQRGVARDLATNVSGILAEVIKSQAPDPSAPQAGTDPAQPAPEPAPAQ